MGRKHPRTKLTWVVPQELTSGACLNGRDRLHLETAPGLDPSPGIVF